MNVMKSVGVLDSQYVKSEWLPGVAGGIALLWWLGLGKVWDFITGGGFAALSSVWGLPLLVLVGSVIFALGLMLNVLSSMVESRFFVELGRGWPKEHLKGLYLGDLNKWEGDWQAAIKRVKAYDPEEWEGSKRLRAILIMIRSFALLALVCVFFDWRWLLGVVVLVVAHRHVYLLRMRMILGIA